MRLLILALTVFAVQFNPLGACATPTAASPPMQVTLDLADGSRVTGTTTLNRLPLRSETLGAMTILLDTVRSLTFSPNHAWVSVTLANGDKLQGQLGIRSLTLQTEMGMVTVPLDHATTMEVRPGSVSKPPVIVKPTLTSSAVQVTLDLANGTRVIGTTPLTHLPIQSEASGVLAIPLDKVRALKFSPNHESVLVTLANGDKLQGRLGIGSLKLQTELGLVTVPLERATAMTVGSGSGAQPGEGLVLWYRFDANEGNRVTDRSGHDNHGQVQGAEYVRDGKGVGALDFSNDRAAIRVGNPPALQLQDFTIALWMKRESTTRISPAYAAGQLFGYGRGGYSLAIQDDNQHHSCLLLSKAGLDAVFSRLVVTDTEFHHVAVTKQGRQVVFFLDGVPDHPMFYDTNFEFHSEAVVGSILFDGAIIENFLGMISEVMVFNRALSAEAVKSLSNSQK